MAASVHGGLGWVRLLLTSLDAVSFVGHVIAAKSVVRGVVVCSPHEAKRNAGRSRPTLRFVGATVESIARSIRVPTQHHAGPMLQALAVQFVRSRHRARGAWRMAEVL